MPTPNEVQDRILNRLLGIENQLRTLKNNDLRHIELRLTKLEENQTWVKGLLFSIIGVVIASSIGVIFSVRW
jgi:tetrahydromethanopterin S-methyltransferase subunit G